MSKSKVLEVARKYLNFYVASLLAFIVTVTFSASIANAQVLFSEDFGSGAFPGPELPAGQTNQIYNVPPQPANFPDILDDGQYVLATDSQQGFTSWASVMDNTPGDGNQGYMLLFNADDNQAGEFYRNQIALSANTNFELLATVVNVNSQGDFDFCTQNEGGLILPNVTLQIQDLANNVLATIDTGDIAFDPNPQWQQFDLTFSTDANTSDIQLVLINNSIGGCGNDLAIDDIIFRIPITIEANNDSISVTEDVASQPNVIFVGSNDTLAGAPLPGTEVYSVAGASSVPPELIFDTTTGGVSVAAGAPPGTFTFDYQVCETSAEFNCGISTVTITVAPRIIDLTKSATPLSPVAGQDVTFTIDVEQTINSDTNNIVITDDVPAGLNVVSIGNGGSLIGNTITWNIPGPLNANGINTASVSFVARADNVNQPTDISNTASAVTDEVVVPVRDTVIVNIQPANPSLEVFKNASAQGFQTGNLQNVPAGTVVTYIYRVVNNGNQLLFNIKLADVHNGTGQVPIPGNETLIDNPPLGDSNDNNSGTDGIWDQLAPGDEVEFTADYTITQQDIDTLQ